jgi:N-acetyl-anhydromuramyl-L-alanine amidase AmpD
VTRAIDTLVVHCSATPQGLDIGAREIDQMHRARKFARIGYHYVIRINGNVELGRPEDVAGAHVQGHNAHSLGICLIGGLDHARKAANTYTPEQMIALEALLEELQARYGDVRVCGHRDLSPDRNHDGKITRDEWLKDCPCFDVATWWAGRAH